MLQKLLVALDGSVESERSLSWARWLAREENVTLLRVVEPVYALDIYGPVAMDKILEESDRYLDRLAREWIHRPGTRVRVGLAASTILDTAREIEADLIVLAPRGQSWRWLAGTTDRLLRNSEVPLFLIPPAVEAPWMKAVQRILVPLDGSAESESIMPVARQLAVRYGAGLVLAHVEPAGSTRGFAPRVQRLADQFSEGWLPIKVIAARGRPIEEISRILENEGADLVVCAARREGLMRRLLHGSVVAHLARRGSVPVLAVRCAARERIQELAAAERPSKDSLERRTGNAPENDRDYR